MRGPIAPCACVLALITGAWFGQAYTLFAPIEPSLIEDTAARAAESTAWRFYDAIDSFFRTGDDSDLLAVIDPDFVDHVDKPGTPSDRDGLVRYLASLRHTHSALRLIPADVVAQGDRVVARLTLAGADDGTILGIPFTGKEPWPRIDMVRVHEGRIVERWGDPAGNAFVTRLFSEALTLPHYGNLLPLLRRVTVAAGTSDAFFTTLGPACIAIESGELEITTTNVDLSSSTGALANGNPKTVTAGEAWSVEDGVYFAVANRRASPVTFLVLTLVQPAPEILPSGSVDTSIGNESITIQNLAPTTATTTNPGRQHAELVRVTLAPGERLAPHRVAGLEIAVVETGVVTVTIAGNPSYAWLQDPQGFSTVADSTAQVSKGSSLAVTQGATTSYTNDTARPATILFLKLAAT